MVELDKNAGPNEPIGPDEQIWPDELIGPDTNDGTTESPARRRGPDAVLLVLGLLTLAMAVAAFVGGLPDLSGFDGRWLVAGGAAIIGLLLLVSSLRRRQT